MDSYVGTQAQVKMNELLERGGIIVGSSAGTQILGGFLVRGDPGQMIHYGWKVMT